MLLECETTTKKQNKPYKENGAAHRTHVSQPVLFVSMSVYVFVYVVAPEKFVEEHPLVWL